MSHKSKRHGKCKEKSYKTYKDLSFGRCTECPDDGQICALKDYIAKRLGECSQSFTSSGTTELLRSILCEVGVLRVAPAIVTAVPNTLRIIINFPKECCYCFDVSYLRSNGGISTRDNCTQNPQYLIDLGSFRAEVAYVLYDCPPPCKIKDIPHFDPPKVFKRKVYRVTHKEDMSSSSEETSEECFVKCKKCKKVCKKDDCDCKKEGH